MTAFQNRTILFDLFCYIESIYVFKKCDLLFRL